MTLTAKPGQKIGLVGPTGAGKSTIINVITRYYDIEAGDIRLDDDSIYDVTQETLRERVGMVLQEPYLFSDTVMANIRYARLDATDDECIAAATGASADSFIRTLPHGYDTVLSGGGSNLSQGQRQLITIARIILANRPVLILDEATSSVDTRTERKLQEALTEDDARANELRHRAPALDDPRLRRDRGHLGRPGRGRRQPRRAHGREGLLPRPLHEPVPGRRDAGGSEVTVERAGDQACVTARAARRHTPR